MESHKMDFADPEQPAEPWWNEEAFGWTLRGF